MFIFVSYPWPVASAHVGLTGPKPPPDAAASDRVAVSDAVEPARHVEEMVRWTDLERLRLQWYRLRLAIADARRPARAPRDQRRMASH